MFDIGFSELFLIGIVALIVIGPERLPKVARTAGHLFGRFQRYASSVKSDISREMQLDELRKAGQNFKESVESAARDVEQKSNKVEAEFTMRDEPVSTDKIMDAAGLSDDKSVLKQPVIEEPVHEAPAVQQASLDWGQPSEGADTTTDSASMTNTKEKA
jgi:sec-independent protein translocase protein TatB